METLQYKRNRNDINLPISFRLISTSQGGERKSISLLSSWTGLQCSQNVGVNGPHHRCFELIVSSSFNQSMAVERGRSHALVGSMVGAIYVHFLQTLLGFDAFDPYFRCGFRRTPVFCDPFGSTHAHLSFAILNS